MTIVIASLCIFSFAGSATVVQFSLLPALPSWNFFEECEPHDLFSLSRVDFFNFG
jgi:hypothetical protein